jgi:16S rRNA G966 N2-methylase RsmD
MTDTLNWPYLPKNIKGIDYTFFDEFIKIYDIAQEHILNISQPISFDKIKLSSEEFTFTEVTNTNTSPDNDLDFIRLDPPYNISCTNSVNGCLKKAAFKSIVNDKYYCWFHINCNK